MIVSGRGGADSRRGGANVAWSQGLSLAALAFSTGSSGSVAMSARRGSYCSESKEWRTLTASRMGSCGKSRVGMPATVQGAGPRCGRGARVSELFAQHPAGPVCWEEARVPLPARGSTPLAVAPQSSPLAAAKRQGGRRPFAQLHLDLERWAQSGRWHGERRSPHHNRGVDQQRQDEAKE